MRLKLIETEGPWLAATVQAGDRLLRVMDGFSEVESEAPKVGEYFEADLSALLKDGEEWEEMFGGNAEAKKNLEPLEGWSYRAFGEIISIDPVEVDCGIMRISDVVCSNDPSIVGKFIAFKISRLDAR
jgi:hypothetical protein